MLGHTFANRSGQFPHFWCTSASGGVTGCLYALRVRGFARNYRNAELDMHFSLTGDLTPLSEFLRVLKNDGVQGLVGRLERGTF